MNRTAKLKITYKLMESKDFFYLFNERAFRYAGGKTIHSEFDTIENFVEDACECMPSFPYNVRNSDTDVVLQSEIDEVANYLIDWLFMLSLVDMFVEKAVRNDTMFHAYSIGSVTNMTIDPYRQIRFTMASATLNDKIIVKINMPSFTANDYEKFNTLQDFINGSRFTIDVNGYSIGSVNSNISAHSSIGTGLFMAHSKEYILNTIWTYAKSNNLL